MLCSYNTCFLIVTLTCTEGNVVDISELPKLFLFLIKCNKNFYVLFYNKIYHRFRYQLGIYGNMKVAGIGINNTVNLPFQRRLTEREQHDYRNNALQPAFDYLGTEEVSMILHGTCFPETENDIGVGSPYGNAAAKLLPFEILHGFNSNQLGPVGVIRDAQKYFTI